MPFDEIVSGVLAGLALAVSFNPLASLFGAIVGAALATRAERLSSALLVLAAAWLVGDGLRIVMRATDLAEGTGGFVVDGSPAASALALVLWALGGVAIGYAAPLWAGAYVGRSVTHGTGWLAAGTVAAAVSAGLATLAAQLPL